jgi:protein-disulfide isomerase
MLDAISRRVLPRRPANYDPAASSLWPQEQSRRPRPLLGPGGRGQADKARALAVAKEVGMDMGRLEKDMASDEARASLEESLKLAETLGLNGTPSYVVGNDVVIGAVGLDALRSKISIVRCGKASC